MGARIIIVSNRVAIPESPRSPVAGGLAVAVKAVLKNCNGLWFGWERLRATISQTPNCELSR